MQQERREGSYKHFLFIAMSKLFIQLRVKTGQLIVTTSNGDQTRVQRYCFCAGTQ